MNGLNEEEQTDLKKLNETFKELLKWVRLLNIEEVKKIRENVLNTDELKIAYHLSDGKNSARTISSVIAPTHSTITDWWQDWYKLGIAEPIGVQRGNRARRLFELSEFGIPVPKFAQPSVQIQEDEENSEVIEDV